MIVSLFAQFVPGVSAKEIDPWENPETYVGSVATFNTTNGSESLSTFHITGDPANYDYSEQWEDDAYWLHNEALEEGLDELPDDYMKLKITDCYDHEVAVSDGEGTRNVRYVWYKVEAEEGYELPEKMDGKPYILYMSSDDFDLGMPSALTFDLIEEGENPETNLIEEDLEDLSYTAPDGMIDPWNSPEVYVESVATFNTESYSNFHIFGDPAAYDFDEHSEDDAYYLNNDEEYGTDELLDDGVKLLITGYYDHNVDQDGESLRYLWFKVEAAEGYELPEKMADKPYVLYNSEDYYGYNPPLLNINFFENLPDAGKPELPDYYTMEKVDQKGYFSEDVVTVSKEPLGTSLVTNFNTAELPAFVDVSYKVTDTRLLKAEPWYYISGTESWPGIETWTGCYVPISKIILVPAEVTELYEALMGATSVDEYDEIMANADSEILEQLTDKHLTSLENHYSVMVEAETRTEEVFITIGDVEIPVTVTGLLPKNATVSAKIVKDSVVMDDGFDIESAEEIILALDIKVLDENGDEWQPKEGRQIAVSIGVEALGYEDGKIFRLHHKHGETIDVFEIFVVMDGKLTVVTNGFSVYVVSEPKITPARTAQAVANNNESLQLTVGEEIVYYADTNGLNTGDPSLGTWQVLDEDGAIFYEVYTNASVGHDGYYAPWIRIVALKETADGVKLYFAHGNRNQKETYTLKIVKPQPDPQKDFDGKKLYIKDNVNEQGVITAVLTDATGNVTPLGSDSKFEWIRSDGAYIVPAAYKDGGSSIDICADHGGLIQRRLEEAGGPTYITYTVNVTLPNGLEKTAEYTVYYQSEILNSSFESPKGVLRSYTFFMNGWPNLYWKTTSPGTGGNLTKDVEYAHYDENNVNNVSPGFYPSSPAHGRQFAELNAEEFGALYQDIITAPGEDVEWEFYHAKRDKEDNGESMYLIMGPTEHAQRITDYDDLDNLVDAIVAGKTNGVSNDTILKNGEMVEFTYTYDGATYAVWYHDADVKNTEATAWDFIKDEYTVPEGQYRTRLFFVSNPNKEQGEQDRKQNFGNLIDASVAGQYKTCLIEYYEEHFEGAEKRIVYQGGYDETETAMIYSTVELKNFDHFLIDEKDYLSQILINGENYPYNIKYPGVASLFVERYSKAKKPTGTSPSGKNYDEYDIVMQIYFRDTIIAVQKWVEFPKVFDGVENVEALTAVQKQKLISSLIDENGGGGYHSTFGLVCEDPNCKIEYDAETIYITKNDPAGWYTGFIPIGDNPKGEHSFTLVEQSIPKLEGLELDAVTFKYYRYVDGKQQVAQTKKYTAKRTNENKEVTVVESKLDIKETIVAGKSVYELVANGQNNGSTDVSISGITLNETNKIAEIQVMNSYREKEVTINYVAVGNGKVDLQDNKTEPVDSVYEKFLYYSGKPKGVVAVADERATFAGWYLDRECTIPVGENHGYVNNTGEFRPNKDLTISDDQLEVTYYAKFSSGSLLIIRENAEPGQVFVYKVEDERGNEMYVTVVVGDNGKGSTEIVNASFGDGDTGMWYTVTQLNDWSWRHDDVSQPKLHIATEGLHGSMDMTTEFVFNGAAENQWLNGNSKVERNIYGGAN